jgi:hypothetical protein
VLDNPVCCISSCCLVLEVGLRLFELLLSGRQISFLDNKDVFNKHIEVEVHMEVVG